MIRLFFDLLITTFDSDDYHNHHKWSKDKKRLFLEQTEDMFESFKNTLKIVTPFVIYALIKDAELRANLKEVMRLFFYYLPLLLVWSFPLIFIAAGVHDAYYCWDREEGRHYRRPPKKK
jgi:hypothetical protein